MKSQLNVLVQYIFRALHKTKCGSIYNKNLKKPVIAAQVAIQASSVANII